MRHRLSRGGNRRINMTLHIAAIVQLRNRTEGRAYYDRKVAAGKTPNEAMRCLKRRLTDIVYQTMLGDLVTGTVTHTATGPGGHRGASLTSSAAGSQPHTGTSDQSLPGPAYDPTQQSLLTQKGAISGCPRQLELTSGTQYSLSQQPEPPWSPPRGRAGRA
jgi:hypothetical protein